MKTTAELFPSVYGWQAWGLPEYRLPLPPTEQFPARPTPIGNVNGETHALRVPCVAVGLHGDGAWYVDLWDGGGWCPCEPPPYPSGDPGWIHAVSPLVPDEWRGPIDDAIAEVLALFPEAVVRPHPPERAFAW